MKLTDIQLARMTTLGIPEYMHGGIIRYYEAGIPPGHFLSAVINNDLKEAFARADDTNTKCMDAYVKWFYNYAPAGSWGFAGAVEKWCSEFHRDKAREEIVNG